jgi:hypothetical protein
LSRLGVGLKWPFIEYPWYYSHICGNIISGGT